MRYFWLVLIIISLLGCNQRKLSSLENQKANLEERVASLERENEELLQENEELEIQLNEMEQEVMNLTVLRLNLEQCKFEFENYKYGNGICQTSMNYDGKMVTVCGAENIIKFYFELSRNFLR